MANQLSGILKVSCYDPVISFKNCILLTSSWVILDTERFWPNNHDIHCRFGMNAIKITCLSFSRGSWPCVSSLLLYHREWLGVMGPTMLMGIDLFQKWINSEFQGLRNDFRLCLYNMISHFLSSEMRIKCGNWGKQAQTQIIWIKSEGEFLSSPIWHLSDDDDPIMKACGSQPVS